MAPKAHLLKSNASRFEGLANDELACSWENAGRGNILVTVHTPVRSDPIPGLSIRGQRPSSGRMIAEPIMFRPKIQILLPSAAMAYTQIPITVERTRPMLSKLEWGREKQKTMP